MSDSLERIRAAIDGDEEAFDALVRHYGARLRWLVQLRLDPALRARLSADDVLQDAMLIASRHIRELVIEDESAFWSWLCRVVEHRLIDLRRRHLESERRDVRREAHPATTMSSDESSPAFDPPALGQSSPSERMRSAEQREILEQALEEIAPTLRDVIVLRVLEGQSVHETAELLGRSPGAISVALHKGMQRLFEALARRAVDLGP